LACLVLSLTAVSCRHLELPAVDRRAVEPVPADLASAYRPRAPVPGLVLEPTGEASRHHRVYALRFDSYSERRRDFHRVEGRVYRALRPVGKDRTPLLQISPILAGAADNYLLCRIFAGWAARRGISSFYVYQEEDILEEERDADDLEALLRENIQDTIAALEALSRLSWVDASRLGSLGISMGAIKNVALMAVEPRLRANGLFLGGSDLAAILRDSRERRVVRYVEKRSRREGLTAEEVCSDLGRVPADPLRFAPHVSSERAFLVLGAIDDKVPFSTGKLLWEQLGKPEAYFILLGHYTGILAAPFAASVFFDYFERELGVVEAVPGA
jgi:hypothetical protein